MTDETKSHAADALADQAADLQDAELSDQELDNVAGGAFNQDVLGSKIGSPGGGIRHKAKKSSEFQ